MAENETHIADSWLDHALADVLKFEPPIAKMDALKVWIVLCLVSHASGNPLHPQFLSILNAATGLENVKVGPFTDARWPLAAKKLEPKLNQLSDWIHEGAPEMFITG